MFHPIIRRPGSETDVKETGKDLRLISEKAERRQPTFTLYNFFIFLIYCFNYKTSLKLARMGRDV